MTTKADVTFGCGHTKQIDTGKLSAMPAWRRANYSSGVCADCFHGRAPRVEVPLALRFGAGLKAGVTTREVALPRALAAIRRVIAARPDLALGAAETARRLTENHDVAWWREYGARVVEEATILEVASAWETELSVAS